MEMFDLYDNNRQALNKTIERGKKCEPNENRQVVHICIFNDKNEMLIQQRQSTKKSWANMWDLSLGGCSIAGETSVDTAQRELFEELGINFDFSNQRPYLTINFENGFDDFFFINLDINLKNIILQDSEVQKVEWASREKITKMIDDEIFIPYVSTFIDSLFDLKNQRGMIRKYF